jgi:hypothetical protein
MWGARVRARLAADGAAATPPRWCSVRQADGDPAPGAAAALPASARGAQQENGALPGLARAEPLLLARRAGRCHREPTARMFRAGRGRRCARPSGAAI